MPHLLSSRCIPVLSLVSAFLSCSIFVSSCSAQQPPSGSSGRPSIRTLNDPYHPWKPEETLIEWEKQAERIRQQILVATGLWPMPEKTPLNPVIHGMVERDDYTVERVYFESRPGLFVSGSLYRPKGGKGPVPGILSPHGHWQDGRFYSASERDAQAQIEAGAEKFQSAARFPMQARMVQLARMGCVVFHYDMIGYADSKTLDHRTGFNDAKAELWFQNLMGLQTWSSIRALDFLESLDDVDTSRLAITGASGGGTQTMILSAIDPRISVAFPAVMVSTAMQGGCVCENASYLRHDINNVAIAALTAPRPMAMTGADDWTIDIETRGLPELKQVYDLYGVSHLVSAKAFPQFKHNYNAVSRNVMYQWMKNHLNLPEQVSLEEKDFEPLSIKEATVYSADTPQPESALSAADLRALMTREELSEIDRWWSSPPDASSEIIGVAVDVMLKPHIRDVSLKIESTRESQGLTITTGMVTYDDGFLVPTTSVTDSSIPSKGVVFWFDSPDANPMIDADGNLSPIAQELARSGSTVISARLYLTGEDFAEELPKVDERFPGYTLGYNLPLVTERVRDILAVVAAHSNEPPSDTTLMGTGEAGVWTLLASIAARNNEQLSSTSMKIVADLNGFAFSEIDSIQHPNLLPGALKYGGLAGLSRWAMSTPSGQNSEIHLFGVSSVDQFKRAFENIEGPEIQFSDEPLSLKNISRGELSK
ncbi:Acetyl xylan esterase (AXE1) [Thalassoglobus neptunius]|uniref:Acetyl xylan esterase (AXE1) n=1 Tax=Thalassoglobus neptunius TaxID=1938619 RepID=A0A5C5X790_9PLAN|nr:acetylxylan esterase [Thalassoglobus neptunius]TWT57892.1 Acetyl xylan esterase (AXE1) [Thalassoglobus neptunius]